MQTVSYFAPSCWMPYLVNGDACGTDDSDVAAADRFVARVQRENPGAILITAEPGGEEFKRWHDAHIECPVAADCVEYVFMIPDRRTK